MVSGAQGETNLTNFLLGDGSGRTLRDGQEFALNWLSNEWNNSRVFAITAPCGSGKTLMTRAIQRELPKTRVITLSNNLVKQYCAEYPETTPYFGSKHYRSKLDHTNARAIAADPHNDICTNVMAYYFLKRREPTYEPADCYILDEADQLMGLMSELTVDTDTVSRAEIKVTPFEELTAIAFVTVKLKETILKAEESLENAKTFDAQRRAENKLSRLYMLHDSLVMEPHKYAASVVFVEFGKYAVPVNEVDKYTFFSKKGSFKLQIKPVVVPPSLLTNIFGDAKVVLMSATIFPSDLIDAFPTERVKRIEIASPIPIAQRRIIFSPTREITDYYPLPAAQMANKIDRVLDKYSSLRPVLIHVTYSDAALISKYLKHKHIIYTNKDDKEETVSKWKAEGGILLGAGLTTGIDLPWDLCRLNIICKIPFPNTADKYVQKRRAIDPKWYALYAARQVVQASGRSTRNETDFSVTVILDNRWQRLYDSVKTKLPIFFRESVDNHVTEI